MSSELASLKAACKICDIIQLAKKQVLPMLQAGESLKKAIKDWFQKHKLAYGRSHFKPKHHWMFDVAEQLIIDNEWQVFDQLIIERLHLLVKNHADRIDNTICFERSVLSGVMNTQLASLQQLKDACCISKRLQRDPIPGFAHAFLGDSLDANGMHMSTGDFILHNNVVGIICACVCERGTMLVIVQPMELVTGIAKTYLYLFFWTAENMIPIPSRIDSCFSISRNRIMDNVFSIPSR